MKFDEPILAAPLIRGVRAFVSEGEAHTLIPGSVPNDYTRTWLEEHCHGLDGYLVVGSPIAKDCVEKTFEAILRQDGEPTVTFYVTDRVDMPNKKLEYRVRCLPLYAELGNGCLTAVQHTRIQTPEALAAYKARHAKAGWPGVVLRDPTALPGTLSFVQIHFRQRKQPKRYVKPPSGDT